jgi:hypothetical protein
VEELLRCGADPRHRNHKGRTALDLAAEALAAVGVAGPAGAAAPAGAAGPDVDQLRAAAAALEAAAAAAVAPPRGVGAAPVLAAVSGALASAAGLEGAAELLAGVHEHPIRRTDRATEWRWALVRFL